MTKCFLFQLRNVRLRFRACSHKYSLFLYIVFSSCFHQIWTKEIPHMTFPSAGVVEVSLGSIGGLWLSEIVSCFKRVRLPWWILLATRLWSLLMRGEYGTRRIIPFNFSWDLDANIWNLGEKSAWINRNSKLSFVLRTTTWEGWIALGPICTFHKKKKKCPLPLQNWMGNFFPKVWKLISN